MALFRALAVVDARRHADVFESENLAVWRSLQDDVGVLRWLIEPADVREHVLFRLGGHARRLTEPARWSDDALLGQGLHHVVDRNVVGAHALWIQPNAHRKRAIAQVDWDTHALNPFEHGHDVHVGVVEEVFLIGVWVRAVQIEIHQHARHDLADENPFAHHQLG